MSGARRKKPRRRKPSAAQLAERRRTALLSAFVANCGRLAGVELEEGSTNHGLTMEFAESNIRYHTFMDPSAQHVQGLYDRLVEKLRFHSLMTSANRLQQLVARLQQLGDPERNRLSKPTAAVLLALSELSEAPSRARRFARHTIPEDSPVPAVPGDSPATSRDDRAVSSAATPATPGQSPPGKHQASPVGESRAGVASDSDDDGGEDSLAAWLAEWDAASHSSADHSDDDADGPPRDGTGAPGAGSGAGAGGGAGPGTPARVTAVAAPEVLFLDQCGSAKVSTAHLDLAPRPAWGTPLSALGALPDGRGGGGSGAVQPPSVAQRMGLATEGAVVAACLRLVAEDEVVGPSGGGLFVRRKDGGTAPGPRGPALAHASRGATAAALGLVCRARDELAALRRRGEEEVGRPGNGPTTQAFAAAARHFTAGVQLYLLRVQRGHRDGTATKTLLHLHTLLEPLRTAAASLQRCFAAIDGRSRSLRVACLLTALLKELRHTVATAPPRDAAAFHPLHPATVACRTFFCTLAAYLCHIERWLFEGQVDDPAAEFFVAVGPAGEAPAAPAPGNDSEEVGTRSGLQSRVTGVDGNTTARLVGVVPGFLKPVAQQIVDGGLAMGSIKRLRTAQHSGWCVAPPASVHRTLGRLADSLQRALFHTPRGGRRVGKGAGAVAGGSGGPGSPSPAPSPGGATRALALLPRFQSGTALFCAEPDAFLTRRPHPSLLHSLGDEEDTPFMASPESPRRRQRHGRRFDTSGVAAGGHTPVTRRTAWRFESPQRSRRLRSRADTVFAAAAEPEPYRRFCELADRDFAALVKGLAYATPVDQVMQKSLLADIVREAAAASQRLVDVIRTDVDILRRLDGMRALFFLQKPSVAQPLLARAMEGAECDSSTLTQVLRDSLEACDLLDPDLVQVSWTSDGAAHQLVRIGYEAPWPVSEILTPTAITDYNRIFGLAALVSYTKQQISQLHHCQRHRVRDLELVLARSTADIGGLWDKCHQVHLVISGRMHFITTLHTYLLDQLVHSGWDALSEGIEGAHSLADMAGAHRDYLSGMLARCLLSDDARVVFKEVLALLQLSLALVQTASRFYDVALGTALATARLHPLGGADADDTWPFGPGDAAGATTSGRGPRSSPSNATKRDSGGRLKRGAGDGSGGGAGGVASTPAVSHGAHGGGKTAVPARARGGGLHARTRRGRRGGGGGSGSGGGGGGGVGAADPGALLSEYAWSCVPVKKPMLGRAELARVFDAVMRQQGKFGAKLRFLLVVGDNRVAAGAASHLADLLLRLDFSRFYRGGTVHA